MKKTYKYLSLCGFVLMAGACSAPQGTYKPAMFEDTTVTQRNIELETSRFVEKKPTDDVNYEYLNMVAEDYKRHGSSPIYVVLAYDPDSKDGKLTSFNKSNVIKGQMAKLGLKDSVVKTMPISGAEEEVVIGYDQITAQGPQNCGQMPGYGAQPGSPANYGLGCTVKDLMAKQIAYPEDLMGQTEMAAAEAGRAAAPVNRDARSGEISEFVPGYILSQIGN